MENCAMQLQKFSKLIVYVVLREKLHIDASIITFKIALYVRLISRHIWFHARSIYVCLYFVSSAIPISYSTTSNENFSTFDYLEINEVNENFSILECNSNVLSDRFVSPLVAFTACEKNIERISLPQVFHSNLFMF